MTNNETQVINQNTYFGYLHLFIWASKFIVFSPAAPRGIASGAAAPAVAAITTAAPAMASPPPSKIRVC
jgi:hypothetical protein